MMLHYLAEQVTSLVGELWQYSTDKFVAAHAEEERRRGGNGGRWREAGEGEGGTGKHMQEASVNDNYSKKKEINIGGSSKKKKET